MSMGSSAPNFSLEERSQIRPQDIRLSVTRAATGYLDAAGNLILDNADYTILIECDHCHRDRRCGWYTGHGGTIRWYCDECAGIPCGSPSWDDYGVRATGPAEIIAPFGRARYPKSCYCREITYDLPDNGRGWLGLVLQPWIWPFALAWWLLVAVIHLAHRLGVALNWHKDMVA